MPGKSYKSREQLSHDIPESTGFTSECKLSVTFCLFFSFIKLFRCGLVFSGYDLKAVRDAFQRWRGFVTSHLLAFV